MKKIGVIGFPIKHSLSPIMWNAGLKYLELDFYYEKIEVPPEKLIEFVTHMKHSDILGVNVTIPHKEKIIPLLDEIDNNALDIGAVNTVVNKDGCLIGYNTDGDGFIFALQQIYNFNPAKKRVLIIGAGGSAKAISYALLKNKAISLTILNRTISKAKKLIANLKEKFPLPSYEILDINSSFINEALKNSDLVINTTPIGMSPNINLSPLSDYDWVDDKKTVFDIIYAPHKTKFLENCEKKGAKICFGIDMLIGQGMSGFKIITGKKAPYEIMKNSLKERQLC